MMMTMIQLRLPDPICSFRVHCLGYSPSSSDKWTDNDSMASVFALLPSLSLSLSPSLSLSLSSSLLSPLFLIHIHSRTHLYIIHCIDPLHGTNVVLIKPPYNFRVDHMCRQNCVVYEDPASEYMLRRNGNNYIRSMAGRVDGMVGRVDGMAGRVDGMAAGEVNDREGWWHGCMEGGWHDCKNQCSMARQQGGSGVWLQGCMSAGHFLRDPYEVFGETIIFVLGQCLANLLHELPILKTDT